MTPIDPIAQRAEPNVQIENVVYGLGKVRSTARTSVAGLGDVMTRRLNEEFAVAERGPLPRLCVYPIVREVIITSRDANYDRKSFYRWVRCCLPHRPGWGS